MLQQFELKPKINYHVDFIQIKVRIPIKCKEHSLTHQQSQLTSPISPLDVEKMKNITKLNEADPIRKQIRVSSDRRRNLNNVFFLSLPV